MTLYTHQAQNVWKTYLLMAVFFGLVAAVGWFAGEYFGNQFIFIGAVVLSVVMNIGSYWFSDKIALAVSGAKKVEMKDNPELWRIVENLAITAGLPMPSLHIIEDNAPNAFATGRDKDHSAIAVTTGLLQKLDRTELEGVIAHEFAHIGNRDILLMSVVAVLVGLIQIMADMIIRASLHSNNDNKHPIFLILGFVLMIFSPIIAMIIQMAISRKREFLADATGALITRYPEGLAKALEKISDHHQSLNKANKGTAHMFIATPFGGDTDGDGISDRHQKVSVLQKMFMTHPPIEERLAALRGMNNQ